MAGALAQDAIPVRIGWLKASLTTIAQPIAEQEGLYAKRGLAARVTAVTSGNNATGIESLLRGDYDVYFGAMSELARLDAVAVEQGAPPPLVAVAVGTPGATHLVVHKDLPFKDVEDLRGKTLGVSSLGSIHVVMFRHYLASRGLTTEKLGLKLLRVGGGEMPPALLTKQIDGFLHSQPPALPFQRVQGVWPWPPMIWAKLANHQPQPLWCGGIGRQKILKRSAA
jgi:ABC-type nitrate/sulfonate/bicarbonate transport system substrate-binding protein